MHRFYAPDITTTMLLPDEEAQHCVRVLRLKEGEEDRHDCGQRGS